MNMQKVFRIGLGGFQTSPRVQQLVNEVLESGRLSAGPMTDRFERAIARLHGCEYGLFCNSGTSALQVSLAALKERHGWRDGDEVLVPALTFVATSNVVLYNNLKPVFVDVESEYYCIDPRRIEERITPRTRAIIPVHVAGLPADMTPLMKLGQQHKLRVIEDACEAMFASYHGQPAGSFGDISCFSTYVAHVITTGVGGLCTTNDPELIVLLKSLINHGRDSIYLRIDDDRRAKGQELFEIVDRRFAFVRFGHSFRSTELEAALGIAEVEEHEAKLARRAAIAARLTDGLADLQEFLQLPRCRPGARHAWMFYPLRVRSGVSRSLLVAWLEDHGIETRYLLPLINQPIYRSLLGNLDSEYPVAANLNETAFYVGCHPGIEDGHVEHVLECFHSFFRNPR